MGVTRPCGKRNAKKIPEKTQTKKGLFYFSPVFNIVPRRMKSRQCAIVLTHAEDILFCSPAELGYIESRDQCSYQSGHFPIFLPTFYLSMCQKVFCHHYFATSKHLTNCYTFLFRKFQVNKL